VKVSNEEVLEVFRSLIDSNLSLLDRTPTLRDRFALAFISRVTMLEGVASAVRAAYELADEALAVRETLK
jgi:hypothetical protein